MLNNYIFSIIPIKYGIQEKSYNRKPRYRGPNKNEFIRAKEVLVIDDLGEKLGTMPTNEALKIAQDKGLDLVEVSPTLTPPVCKILDYSKYLYEQKKKKRGQQGGKQKPMKEFRFSPVIDIHDFETKVRRATEFLDKGHNVRITVRRKGRQTRDQSKEMMATLLTKFDDYSSIEPEPRTEGRQIFQTYKPNGKAKNKQNGGKKVQTDKAKG